MAIAIWILGALGLLPRVKPSTKGEGHERRYFYGAVWAVCFAQPALGALWVTLPRGRAGDAVKLIAYVAILAVTGRLARRGVLPRTRRILPGELAISDYRCYPICRRSACSTSADGVFTCWTWGQAGP